MDPLRTGVGSPVTAEGCIVGTAAYMAPEQALGKPVNSCTDIFSLGAVLYEMLTGRRAFDGDSAISTLTAVLRDEPTDICILNREVPQAVADVVYRCLRKNPEERYANAADLKKELDAALEKPVVRTSSQPTVSVAPFQNFTTEANDYLCSGSDAGIGGRSGRDSWLARHVQEWAQCGRNSRRQHSQIGISHSCDGPVGRAWLRSADLD